MKKSIFKKIAGLVLASAMLFTVGCGGGDNSSSSSAGEDNSLQNVLDAKTLKLGLDPTFKPMGFTDENDQIVGFDIDVAKEVANRMGVSLETVPVNWDTKEQDLEVGTIDCIWNGLSVSDERKKVMLMSEPYMKNDMIFVVSASSDVSSPSDLAGKKIAVQNGSTAQEILEASDVVKKDGASVTALATNVEALQQLDLEMVDAVFLDSVVANYEISSSGKDYVILNEGLESEEYAIGFKLGSQKLCDEVTRILKEMKADGTLGEISTNWFGSDVTIIS